MRASAQSEVFEYDNGSHLVYVARSFGRFGDVSISSSHQKASRRFSKFTYQKQVCSRAATAEDDSRTTKSTFSASECRSNLRES